MFLIVVMSAVLLRPIVLATTDSDKPQDNQIKLHSQTTAYMLNVVEIASHKLRDLVRLRISPPPSSSERRAWEFPQHEPAPATQEHATVQSLLDQATAAF